MGCNGQTSTKKFHVGYPHFIRKHHAMKDRVFFIHVSKVKLKNEVGPPIKYLIYVWSISSNNVVWLWIRKRIT